VVAAALIAEQRGAEQPAAYTGIGSCYVEFGAGRVARVDVEFLTGPTPTGSFMEPSVALAEEKKRFGSSRRARWFGLSE
jgi:sulfide:quinone oxidoreductase